MRSPPCASAAQPKSGDHRPGALSNVVLVLLVLVSAYLTFSQAGEWWRTLVR